MNDADWTRKRFRGWAQGCSVAVFGSVAFVALVVLVSAQA